MWAKMTCSDYEDLILESLDGSLEPDRAQVLRTHLAHCSACAALDRLHRQIDGALEAHFEAIARPVEIRERTLERVARQPRLEPPSYLPEVLDLVGLAGAGASAVAAAFAFLPLPPALYHAAVWAALGITSAGGLWLAWYSHRRQATRLSSK